MEHKSQPFSQPDDILYTRRQNLLIGGSILILYVVIGAIGYHVCGRLDCRVHLQCSYKASGMGP